MYARASKGVLATPFNSAGGLTVTFEDNAENFKLSNDYGYYNTKTFEVAVSTADTTHGVRQGAVYVGITRPSTNALITGWDGNDDCCLKMLARNYANNLDGATRIGGERALNVAARNSGTNLSWVKTIEVNARNDSGKNVSDINALHVRCENYGNIYSTNIGIDVEMSDENLTQSQVRTGILVRSTDASAQSAVNNVFKVSHTSTNGFTSLFYFNATTGDTTTAGSLKDSTSTDITCDAYVTCSINGTPYYLPLYDTLN